MLSPRGTRRGSRSGFVRALAALVCLHLVSAPAFAQSNSTYDEAVGLYQAGQLRDALTTFQQALEVAGNSRETVIQIHRMVGALHAILGDDDAARASFVIALSIDASVDVPSELSPDQRAIFEAAREDATPIAVDVDVATEPSNEAATTLRLRATGPSGLIAQFRVEASPPDVAPWSSTVAVSDPAELAIPAIAWRAAEAIQLRVSALDAYGGTLRTTETVLRHRTAVAPPDPLLPDPDPATTGGSNDDWIWGLVIGLVVAGAAAATATALALTIGPEVFIVGEPEIQR